MLFLWFCLWIVRGRRCRGYWRSGVVVDLWWLFYFVGLSLVFLCAFVWRYKKRLLICTFFVTGIVLLFILIVVTTAIVIILYTYLLFFIQLLLLLLLLSLFPLHFIKLQLTLNAALSLLRQLYPSNFTTTITTIII